MAKVRITGISDEISNLLTQYKENVIKEIEIAKEVTAKETVAILKKTSPKKTGRYRKGWRVTDIKGKKIIHNKTDYQLTHLLENGYAKVNGGRVAPKVHIRPAEEKAIKDYVERVEKAIKR